MKSSLGVLLMLGGMNLSAYAASYTFNFNSPLTAGDASSAANLILSSAAIATYMTNALVANGCAACSVAVVGAVADTTYTADGHVVGPGTGATSLTLGNSDGATVNSCTTCGSTDTFIANTDNNGKQGSTTSPSTEIELAFSGLTITQASFDFEVFPDNTCPSISSCGSYNSTTGFYANQPDLEFTAGTGGIGTGSAVNTFGTLNNGLEYGVVPASTSAGSEKAGSNGSSTKSPGPPLNNPEAAPQWIGVSGNLALSGVTDLNFIDWPATIGIDNLAITYGPPGSGGSGSVPEPSSILLFASAAGALLFRLRRIVAAR